MLRGEVDNNSVPDKLRSRRGYVAIAIVLLVIVIFGLIRFRLRNFPLERDEGEYAYSGQLILQGIPPYELAYNMKLPGVYAAYALLMAVFGQTSSGVHLGLIVINSVTIFLIYLLASRLSGRLAGAVAAASYAVLSVSPSVLGMAGHATHFVVLPAIAGVLLLLKALEGESKWLILSSGLLLGLAFIMKQPGVFFSIFGLLYFVYRECQQRPANWQRVATRSGIFVAGLAIPFGLTCLILFATGTFHNFWFWTFSYAREYGSIVGPVLGSRIFLNVFPHVVGPSVLIWVVASFGLAALIWDRRARANATFLIGFLLFSMAAVCPGFYFREHYFILVLPAVALLTGVAVNSGTRLLPGDARFNKAAVLPVILFVAAFGYTVFQQRDFFFTADPVVACRTVYGANPFPEALKIADYIKTHSSPGERIAVLGSEPEIYFYSGRRSATGYIYTYGLMERQKYALTMQREMISEIEAAHPGYVVIVRVPTSWLVQPGSPTLIFSWAKQYLQQYELVGIADVQSESRYVWDEAAKDYAPQSPFAVYVFKRRNL